MNVGALLVLMFFIYAVLGVFLFGEILEGEFITKYNNFWNWGNAMLCLFRSATGEDWALIFYNCIHSPNSRTSNGVTTVFFMSFIMMSSFIMLNLFIMIIIEYFENFNLKEDNPLELFNTNIEIFKRIWNTYSDDSGEKMNSN